ncbi:MAG: hypothetical protein JRH20_29590 [Deltaproteobacteria bacterium]|nr:hypothetical protein [Deltaproteobacteria bacterium]
MSPSITPASNVEGGEGAAYVYFGLVTDPSSAPDITLENPLHQMLNAEPWRGVSP